MEAKNVVPEIVRRTGCSIQDARAVEQAFADNDEGPEQAVEDCVSAIQRWEAAPKSNLLLYCEIEELRRLLLIVSGEVDELREQIGKA